MVIGIVGGLRGGWLGKVIFGVDSIDGFFSLATWIAAFVGSVLVLLVYRLVAVQRPADPAHTLGRSALSPSQRVDSTFSA